MMSKWDRVRWAFVVVALLGSASVILSKDRYNQRIRWQMWVESDSDSRIVRQPVTWASVGRQVRIGGQRLCARLPQRTTRKVQATAMAWIVTGAGDNSYNGTYNESGTYNGQPAYTNGSRWLWEYGGVWNISASKGHAEGEGWYQSATDVLPSTWAQGTTPLTAPAPTLSDSTMIRIGSSEADAALWDVAANHRYSKYGEGGGYRDVDAAMSARFAPALPFQYSAPEGETCRAVLTIGGHTWATAEGLAGGEDVQSGSLSASGSGLPFAAGGDAWEGYLGSAGSKTLTLTLYKASDNTKLAEDTGAYTMFVPALAVTTDPATTVPDRFDATVAWDEWWATSSLVRLTVVQSGVEYDLRYMGVTLSLLGTTPVTTGAGDVDLAFLGTSPYQYQWVPYCLPAGALVLRAQHVDWLGQPSPVPKTEIALMHSEQYDLQIISPSSGAELGSGVRDVALFLAQGWYPDSLVRLNGALYEPEGVFGEFTTIDGFGPNGHPAARYLRALVTLLPADTAITADWGYYDGSDWISLDTASIPITIAADGGLASDEGLPPTPPVNEGGTTTYPPWVQWALPPAGSTVTPTVTATIQYGNYTATAAGHLSIVAVKGTTSVTLHDADLVLGGSGVLSQALDFGAAEGGTYTLYITLTGASGEAATTAVTLVLDSAGSADTTAPTVAITSPATGAAVTGTITAQATAADNDVIWRVAWLVDGAVQGYSFAPAGVGSFAASYTLDTRLLLNGAHTLAAIARDVTGNVSATATVTINVSNSQADLTRIIVSQQMGVGADGLPLNTASANWTNTLKRRWMMSPVLPKVLPEDPRLRYNVYFGYNVPGTATDWSEFSLAEPFQSFVTAPTKTIRFAMLAVPQQTQASYDIAAESLLRLTTARNGDPLVLASTPHGLWRFAAASSGLTQLADLSGLAETPADVCAVAGKVYVAHGAKVLVVDEDTGELTDDLDLDFQTGKAAITALATDGTALYAAATLTAGGSRIYRYTAGATTAVASHTQAITTMAWLSGALWVGNDAGQVLTLGASGLTLAYETGQASVSRLGSNASTLYAGTGDAGQICARVGAWGLNWDSGFTAVRGLGSYNGWVWAAGTGEGARYIWYERAPKVWAQGIDTDSQVTAINDLLSWKDASNGHEQLFVAATRSGGTCRLYRVELAPASSWQCGVDVPAVEGKAV